MLYDPDWTDKVVKPAHINAIWEIAGGTGAIAMTGELIVPALKKLYDHIRVRRTEYHGVATVFHKG